MILKHYYHIYADGVWELPVKEHLEALQKSGLYDKLQGNFYVGIVGSEKRRRLVKDYLDQRVEYSIVAEADKGWEQETQDKLYEDALSGEPFKVFYAHTKGASNFSIINNSWRRIMTEITVDRWEEAVNFLDDYDAVGGLWLSDSISTTSGGESIGKRGFFAGTFWWANSEYIATLGYPARTSRWDAESWVGETARITDDRGTTVSLKDLPAKDIRIYDMHPSVPNLTKLFQQRVLRERGIKV